MAASVLIPIADGFEEIETIAPVDLLRRAGIRVILASLADNRHATGRCGVTVHADIALSAVGAETFDMLLLPGGPGVKALRADLRVRDLVQRHHGAGAWLAAICAAPTLLHDAGLLTGKRFTAHFSVADELPGLLASERVVIDGRMITARGAGTAMEFGLQIVTILESADKAQEISKAICF